MNVMNFRRSSTLAKEKHGDSCGNSEDDETPQRAVFAIEEAHREPAESVVFFRSGHSAPNMILVMSHFISTMKMKKPQCV
ncbi:hypothetical protein CFK40_05615 [Virgibacillus necropolis]|uniref:Uncharacterized protein n=1 Tax=Virgibacillus necropolis TaxID=163877 RepID=A0A221MA45_9BACI|nr:hypothetical protein CFK40_05615 [Virgibacillus necropolis]